MSITLKELAKKNNLSVATFSRVLNNKGNVKEETRILVEEALKEAGYIPNKIASSLKNNSTKTVGIIIPDICEVFFSGIISGIDTELSKHGYAILLADSKEQLDKEEKYLNLFLQQRVDALVYATSFINDCGAEIYLKTGIPVVFIDNLPNNIKMPYDAVLTNNYEAGRMGAKHLLELGHKNIAVITGIDATPSSERLNGVRQEYAAAGYSIPDELVTYGYFKEKDGVECMAKLLDQKEKHPFTAVVVMHEMMAAGAIKVIKSHGLRIPEDISLLGYDIHDRMGLAVPAITTIKQPEEKIGNITAKLLLDRLNAKQQEGIEAMNREIGQKILLDPIFEKRESCIAI